MRLVWLHTRTQFSNIPIGGGQERTSRQWDFLYMTHRFSLKDIGIHAASLRDMAALLRYIKAYYRFDRISFSHEAIRAGLLLLLKEQMLGRAWLIRARRKSIGYLLLTFGFDLEFGGRQATVTDFYIDGRYLRKGVGRKALMEVEEFCRACGVKALELQVTRKNARALAFYKQLGFEAYDRVPMSKRIRSSLGSKEARSCTNTRTSRR